MSDRRFRLTELGNAERLAATYGDRLRYVRAWSAWLIWDGRRWCRDNVGVAMAAAKEVVRGMFTEASELAKAAAAGDDDAAEYAASLAKWARQSSRASVLRATATIAETEEPIAAMVDMFDRDHWLLNVENGTVDLRTGNLRPHRREDMITMLAPVTFNARATAPTWERFLERVLPDGDVRGWLQRFLGYCLTGDVGAQIMTFLWGTGANGKSTFLGAVQALLGDYALQAPPGLLLAQERSGDELGRRQRALLLGKRFVVSQEIEAGRYLNETQVKQLTGGDKVSAARLWEMEIEFSPTFKIAVATNSKPVVRGQDMAIWRRLRLVPFTETVPPDERDPDLPTKLAAEASGILAWCVRGCLAWQCEGLAPPAAVVEATDKYRADEDRLGEFLEVHTERDPTASVLLADLHRRYSTWCVGRDERAWSSQALRAALEERSIGNKNSNRGKVILGLRLRGPGTP